MRATTARAARSRSESKLSKRPSDPSIRVCRPAVDTGSFPSSSLGGECRAASARRTRHGSRNVVRRGSATGDRIYARQLTPDRNGGTVLSHQFRLSAFVSPVLPKRSDKMRPPGRMLARGFGVTDDLDLDGAGIDRVLISEVKPAACRHVELDQPGAPRSTTSTIPPSPSRSSMLQRRPVSSTP